MTYLIDAQGRVVHTWKSEYSPSGTIYLLDNGNLLRGWSRLSDDTILDFPYGIQVIEFPG